MLLFQLLTGTQEALMNRARVFYSFVLAKLIALSLILVFIGYICNIAGGKGINLFFSLVTTIIAIMIAIRPEIVVSMVELAVLYGAGTGTTIPDDVQKFAQWYIKIVNKVLMWLSLVFFSLGTISLKENPKAFFGIVSGLVLLGLLSSVWGLGGKLGKKLIYWYASLMVFLFFMSLIPGAFYKGVIGYDPRERLDIENEKIIDKIEKELIKKQKKDDKKILEDILTKIEDEDELSPKEKEALKKYQKERDKNTLPGIAGKGISKIKGIIPQTPSSSPSTLSPIQVEPQKSKWTMCRNKDCFEVQLQIIGDGEAINIFRFEPGIVNIIAEGIKANKTSEGKYDGSWWKREPYNEKGCAVKFAMGGGKWISAEIKIASGEILQMKK